MSDPYMGEIRMVAFNFAPVGWALCNGQTMNIAQYSALFALLGTIYGGDGVRTFQLPDLQGRVPLHAGAGGGLPTYIQGQKAGFESITLTQQQLPVHTHMATFVPSGGGGTPSVTINASSTPATATTAAGNYLSGTVQGAARGSGAMYATTPGTLGALNSASVTLSGIGSGGGTVTNGPAGQGQAFSIEPPYLAIYFVIALQGIYPTRN